MRGFVSLIESVVQFYERNSKDYFIEIDSLLARLSSGRDMKGILQFLFSE